jgi:DNA-binding MarR family transcriptional regulator
VVPADREALAASLQHFGIERDRMRAALARRIGMSETDLDALEHLEAGPLTQRELSERLALTSGAITMLVDRLERSGLARRRPHPADRRYTLIELTDKVEADAPPELARFHTAIRALVARVPSESRRAITEFLEAAADAASTAAHDLGSSKTGS